MVWHVQPGNPDWTFVVQRIITKVRGTQCEPYALLTYKLINFLSGRLLRPDVLADSLQENKKQLQSHQVEVWLCIPSFFKVYSLFGKHQQHTC